jgi:type IV pilus assembly protein PilM
MSDSIWKKEISFGRKKAEQPAQPEAAKPEAVEAAPEQPSSVWKKELSFGRKKAPAAQPAPAEPAPSAEPAEAEQPASVWKKEISFGRKKAQKAPKAPKPPKQEKAAGGESTSVWKKELSFGRKKADVEPEPVAAPEPVVPAAAAEPVAQPESELGPVPEAIANVLAPRPAEPEPVEAEDAALEPDYGFLAPEPADEPVSEPVEESAPIVSFTVAPAEPVAAAPELPPAPEPAPAVVPTPVPVPQPEPEPVAAEVAAAPEPVVVHPPVPAAELPELTAKVPFWKKELSFGGKGKQPKEKAPKGEKAPKEPKAKKEKAPKQPRRLRAPRIEMSGGKNAKRFVGLKVGASQLAAARVSNNGVAELLQVARQPLEPGIVVGGELREPGALAEALKAFFDKNRLPKKGVRLGIANNRIGVRTFEIEGIQDPKQLDNAIKFRAQETLPIPIEDAVLDYQVLNEYTREDGQQVRKVLLVVAYRDLIDRYIDACKKAGIVLAGIDLEAFALLRALQAPQEGAGGNAEAALVAVAIGHERSTFAVSDGRTCEFTRVLDWGGAALNVALARTLDAAPSEVEDLKRSLPLNTTIVPDGLAPERAAQARDAMSRAIQVFARELVSSLQFYQNQPGSLGIGEIVLSGGTAHLTGLAEELERLIGVRVRVGDPLARMKVAKKVGEPEQVGSLAVAIGLGIED